MRSSIRITTMLCPLLLLILILPSSAAAQGFGVPISNTVVTGELHVPDLGIAYFELREGTLLTIRHQEEGIFYGLAPAIDRSGNDVTTSWMVLDIEEQGAHQTLTQKYTISDQEMVHPETIATPLGELVIIVQNMKESVFERSVPLDPLQARPLDLQSLFGRASGGVCCVSCSGWTICGGSVTLSCGSCDGGGSRVY